MNPYIFILTFFIIIVNIFHVNILQYVRVSSFVCLPIKYLSYHEFMYQLFGTQLEFIEP